MLSLPIGKKAFALRTFKMAIKHPTLATFYFKISSYDRDRPSQITPGENTNACSLSIPDTHGPPKK